MDRKSFFTLFLVMLGGAIGFHGVFTNIGPVGWLNAVQQRFFGSYYSLVSFAVVVAAVSVTGAMLWDGLARLRGKQPDGVLDQVLYGPQTSTQAQAAPSAHGTTFFLSALAISVLTWSICGGLYWKKIQNLKEDASATYEPIVLSEGTPIPAFQGRHLSLRGILVNELQVVHKTGKSVGGDGKDYRLMPLVGVGWKPERPASFILKLDSAHVEPMPIKEADWKQRNPREIRMLVRLAGTVPTPAVSEFKKIGVPLSADASLIIPVASQNGRPVMADTSTDLFFLKISCIGITFISAIMSLALWLRRRYDLKKAGFL